METASAALNNASLKPAIMKFFLSCRSFIQKAAAILDKKKKIKIINTQGQLLYDQLTINTSHLIDTSRFAAGVYFVMAKTGSSSSITPLVIKK